MATRLFSEDQMERLQSFPDIGRDELIRFFTLTLADVAFVDPGRGRGPVDRLGLAVQLCTLPWVYRCRSQTPKFWAPFQSTGAFITILPAAVPVVVSVYSLVAQGPMIVPRSPL